MNLYRTLFSSLTALSLSLLAALPAWAEPVNGEIVKVLASQQKLTLRHEAIPSLDMPAMTMNYRLAKPEMLNGLKAGDKVVFEAEDRKGSYVVTSIQVKP
jgi:Cu/Ag efflux protein CusF